jgi:hypothetical protein
MIPKVADFSDKIMRPDTWSEIAIQSERISL